MSETHGGMSGADSSSEPLLRYRGRCVVRLLGGGLLTASAVMTVLGVTVLRERLPGLTFIRYWMWCLWIAVAAIGMALLDIALLRRRASRLRRELFRQQFLSGAAARRDPTETR